MMDRGLHREVHGQGEPVLIIQGAIAEAGATARLTAHLAEHGCQVITYDHRGLSRSASENAPVPVSIRSHAADAAGLLQDIAERPARVVGTSIGAVIGLELVQRHPELVRALIAHEPPLPAVVPDPDQLRGLDAVAELADRDVLAAARLFASLGGTREESREEGAHSPPPVGDTTANLRQFFAHDFAAVRNYTPDLDELREVPVSITLTAGALSGERWEHRCARRLAELIERKLVELPGGHDSLVTHPQTTAELLLPMLKEP